MKFKVIEKFDGYQIRYNRRVKTGAIMDLTDELAAVASKDSGMESLDKPPPAKKAVKKAVKKRVVKKK